MSIVDKYLEADRARLRRIVDNPEETAAARAIAAEQLNRLDPACRFCEKPTTSHGRGRCPVLARFQQRHGKDCTPTDGQAAELRRAMAEDEEHKRKAAQAKDARERQGRLF